ncbi:MAG TPA: hypothetical protein VGR07_00180 [Thermoanaerobaculia bacterium]|jgi:hypothetical protein|nr:hypothetical protein [Thermoanaerobaculia bacterium]
MSFDPIVDEVQRIRQEQAARFDYNIDKIYEELKRLERQDPAPILRAPEKPPQSAKSPRTRLARS